MREHLVRKVASLLRERDELDRRLANVTGGAVTPEALAGWLSRELWDVDAPPGGGIGVFTDGPLRGRSVACVWTAGDDTPADDIPARADADYVLEYTARPGRLSVERVRLVARDGTAAEVFPKAAAPLRVDDDQAAALGLFSAGFAPPLTRYH